MFELVAYLCERQCETLRNPHKPRLDSRPFRWPRLWPRFNYRTRRQRVAAGN